MEELAIILRLANKANEKLMTTKLKEVLEGFGYNTLTSLYDIAYWEWELIINKFKRTSKEFSNIIKILEISDEFKEEKARLIREKRRKQRAEKIREKQAV